MSPKKDWFKTWFGSPYYKLLYQHRDDVEAEAFVQRLLDYLQPSPGARMLDIACGEGRFAVQLANRGYDVVGIDISEETIERAKREERKNLRFFIHDMRLPFYSDYFDYAFNFFTSFGYFDQIEDHHQAAQSFAQELKKHGLLIIDYLNRDNVLANLVKKETIVRGDYQFDIERGLEGNHILKTIRFIDGQGTPRKFVERVAAFSMADFIHIFRQAGLKPVTNFGDYQLNAYDPVHSPRMISVFKK